MRKVIVLGILFLVNGFCQNCLTYGMRMSLEGTLSLIDASGYAQFIVLRPPNPICTVRDPKDPANEYNREQNGVTEIQVGVYGSDAASAAQSGRLDRLI